VVKKIPGWGNRSSRKASGKKKTKKNLSRDEEEDEDIFPENQ